MFSAFGEATHSVISNCQLQMTSLCTPFVIEPCEKLSSKYNAQRIVGYPKDSKHLKLESQQRCKCKSDNGLSILYRLQYHLKDFFYARNGLKNI